MDNGGKIRERLDGMDAAKGQATSFEIPDGHPKRPSDFSTKKWVVTSETKRKSPEVNASFVAVGSVWHVGDHCGDCRIAA